MLLLSFCGGGWRGVEWGVQSHFRVQPNFCVEVLLCYVVVGGVTTITATTIIKQL